MSSSEVFKCIFPITDKESLLGGTLNGIIVGLYGLLITFLIEKYIPHTVVSSSIVRVQLDGSLISGQSLFITFKVIEGNAFVIVKGSIVRVQLDGSLIGDQRLIIAI